MPIDIADIFVILKPQELWTKASSKQDLIDKVRKEVSVLPGVNFEFSQPVEMRFNELLTGVREDIAVKLYGDDLEILANKAEEIKGLISGIDGVAGVNAEATRGLPQITVKYDRNKMGRYGLNISELNTMVESAFSGGIAGKIYEGEKMYDLVVRLDEKHRKSIDDIKNLYVNLSDGNQIPLKEVANISYQPGPMQISRDNTNRRTYVGVNVENRDVKSLVNEIQAKLDKNLKLPTGYYIRYGGAFENLERATKRLFLVVPLALLLIFLLVYFAVKSIKQTMMIYIAIPFAAIGGVYSLYLRDMPFSISAGVGFIVLFGVAVLNGLVLISSFNELKEEGKLSLSEIINKGTLRRIRPILLTASTDILGFLPMALSVSAGAEVQRPLATVVIGGMLTATFLTLIVLPVMYKFVESNKSSKMNLNPILTTIVILILSIGFSQEIKAQTIPVLSLEEVINKVKEVHPSIKVAELEIYKQEALEGTVYDYGKTSVFTGMEEIGDGKIGVFNIIGFNQEEIDIFNISNKKDLNRSRVNLAVQSKKISENSLSKNINEIYLDAVFYKKQLSLFIKLDSVFKDFVNAAELRYKTQETSKIEFLSASAKYKEIQLNKKQAESNFLLAMRYLNSFLMLNKPFEIDTNEMKTGIPKSNINYKNINSSILDYYKSNNELLKVEWENTKASYKPKLNVSYKLQSIDGSVGFHAWEIGASIPVSYFPYKAKTKAAKLEYEISSEKFNEKKIIINSTYDKLITQYMDILAILRFYRNETLPLASEQINAAKLGYKLGSIDYLQFIQNVESAMKTKQDYLNQLFKLNKLEIQIKYLKK